MRNVYFQPQTKEVDLLTGTILGITIGNSGANQNRAMSPHKRP